MHSDQITEIQTTGNSVKFYTTTDFLLKRAETLLTVEPETIAWIDQMEGGEHLWDIGANVGTYSIYASAARDLTVTSFEPEAANFNLLNKNIRLNDCQQKMLAYPIAVGSGALINTLFLSDAQEGWACHSVGEDLDPFLKERSGKLPQGTICLGLDTLCETHGLKTPAYIKVDVDGLEHQVVASAEKLLASNDLKSLLIELTLGLPEHKAVIDKLKGYGFHVHDKLIEKTTIQEGCFKGMCNVIFARDEKLLDAIYDRVCNQA